MTSFASPNSSLDGSAAEFVPCEELRQELNRRTAISAIREMLEPIFDKRGVHFRNQLDQLKKVASNKSVNASHLIGDILGDVATLDPNRAPTGFRFFKQLRTALSVSDGCELEAGLTGRMHELTKELISGNSLQQLLLQSIRPDTASSVPCEEAGGDKPDQSVPQCTSRLFGVLMMLNLLITRLNLSDSPDECVCVPPALPCVDLCRLVEATCHLQLTYHRASFSDDPSFSETVLFDQKTWASFVYHACDSFSQCLLFINCLLAQANSHITNGSWSNGTHVLNHTHEGESNSGHFGTYATVSSLMSAVLTQMRELLLDERLPSKLMRTTVLDLLLTSDQLTNYPALPAELESGSNESVGDDVYECYQHFLEETNQVSTG
ncbi:unnamed protein product [Dicrocoelium dendriticum]|nr:unnamed protein product [Dicrocoelium dendriticum]